jgi:hypothetical protein
MTKRLLVTLLVAAVILGTVSTAFAASFSVTNGTKYEGAVGVLSSLGILNGFPDGTFKPGDTITRALRHIITYTQQRAAAGRNVTTVGRAHGGTAALETPFAGCMRQEASPFPPKEDAAWLGVKTRAPSHRRGTEAGAWATTA